MNSPEISVIMSVFNAEKHIERSVKSILSQTFNDFEFLIVDDKSEDESLLVLERLASEDKRIRLYRNNTNLGLTKNLNFLILKSKGKFIARMDADDISFATRFEKQRLYMLNKIVDLIGSSIIEIDEYENKLYTRQYPLTTEEARKTIVKTSPLAHPTVFAKSSVLKQNLYNESLRTCQDIELWFRLLKKDIIIENIYEPLLLFRRDNNFISRRGLKKGFIEFRIYMKGIIAIKPFSVAYIYPMARLIIRALPNKILKKIYNSKLR